MILDVTQSHQRIKRLHQRAATRQNPQLQRKAASESPTYKSSAVRGADAGGLGVNAAAVKLRPIPDECRRQTHRISEKKRAINAPLANESDWRSSQSRAGDVELVSVIIILALGVPAHTETQTDYSELQTRAAHEWLHVYVAVLGLVFSFPRMSPNTCCEICICAFLDPCQKTCYVDITLRAAATSR